MSESSRWIGMVGFLSVILLATALKVAVDDNSNPEMNESASFCERRPDPRNDKLLLYHVSTTTSTQDEARRILQEEQIPPDVMSVAVTTTEQTKGRGTNGREWWGSRGNTFVTVCIRQRAWMTAPKVGSLPLTWLPLLVGTVTAGRVQELLQTTLPTNEGISQQPKVTIKWPNDVLVNRQKISGVLIESEQDWFLIGVGVNVAYAPNVPTSGPNHGRTSTCILDYSNKEAAENVEEMARELGVNLAFDLTEWLAPSSTTRQVMSLEDEWRSWVDWKMELVLRDTNEREPVQPLDIEKDGRLLVRSLRTGQERLVVADYFI